MSRRRNVLPLLFIGFLAVVGLAFLAVSLTYDYWASFGPGPGMLPSWLAGGLLVCTAFLLYAELGSARWVEVQPAGAHRLLIAIGLMVATALAVPFIGMMPALALFVFLFGSVIDRNSYRFSAFLSLATVGAIYLIFGVWLGVQFPEMYF